MLAFALFALTAVPFELAAPPTVVVAVPFRHRPGTDGAARARSDAVEGALPGAARARGLASKRTASVKPIDEAARACADDPCRIAAVRRLGTRWVVLGHVEDAALVLVLHDVDDPQSAA